MKTTSVLNERILAKDVKIDIDGHKTGLNSNILCLGGSGSGKTTGFICPNLNHPVGSFIVQDTKGQLFKQYHAKLLKNGYKVFVVDFVNPENSYGYNPFEYIRKRPDGTYMEKDILKLATLLMPVLDQHEPFWEKAASRYIAMLIAYVLEALPEEEHNLKSVVKLHQQYDGGGEMLLLKWSQEHPESYAGRKYKMLSGTHTADKTWYSIMEFANSALDPFDCLEFDRILSVPDTINLHEISKQKTAVFLNTSDSDTSYGILTNIFNAQLLQTLLEDADALPEGRLPIPVNIFLDDFAAAGSMSEFDNTISIIRSRNISVSIMLQSLSQLERMYSKESAKTIINNCDHILYLGGGHDLDSATFIAEHADLTPHSVLTLPIDKAILLTRGEKHRIVGKIKPTDPITGLTKE